MRSDRERLLDILEAIQRIKSYAGIDKETFEHDELIQTWMVYNLQVIGEAASQISEEFRALNPLIPWKAIAAMRDTIVHAYFRVDLDEVWNVVLQDIPALKAHVEALVEAEWDAS